VREELPPQSAQALLELQREAALPYLREELPQAIDESLEGIQRVAKIVRAMKEFSHPGGPEKVSVDVNHSLVTTCTVTRSEWKQHAEMVMDLDAGNPVIQGLPAELHQVFLNLVMNAADAIAERQQHDPGPGVITLSTLRIDHGVEIRVSDNGSGIPKDIQSKIFDPFFTTKGVGKGTGQGLTVCYQVVVTRHGGTIQCQSEPGRGTTFLIRLPARDGFGPAQGAEEMGL
jgi:signal transduction histidine kinase